MEMRSHFLFIFLGFLALAVLAHAQDQDPSGFINVDCGLPGNTTYTDATTGLNYISDESLIETGISKRVAIASGSDSYDRQLWHVRSFPQGDRHCYNVTVTKGNKYLIRARFMYGNYDGQNELPEFDLHLGPNKWDVVKISDASDTVDKEIINISTWNYVYICVVNTGYGTPFVSALEIRPSKNDSYVTQSGSLMSYLRLDIGSSTNQTVRYPDDVYDRIWGPSDPLYGCAEISTSETPSTDNSFQPPSTVMSSADIPANASEPMEFNIGPQDTTLEFYFYMHFAEIVKLEANQSRYFNITLNGEYRSDLTPSYLDTTTVYSTSAETGGKYNFSIFNPGGSTLPPLLNAIEIYSVVELPLSQTQQADVNAIASIKSTYGIRSNWQGDPCAPRDYVWKGLNCSGYNDPTAPPRIISLNLSSSGLMGEIAADIANLELLESLDLSNNKLTGSVPDFLSELQSLKFLNLTGNKLTGAIPAALYHQNQTGSLSLSVDGNPELCPSVSCQEKRKKSNNTVVPVIASVTVGALVLLTTALAVILRCLKRKKKQSLVSNSGASAGKVELKTSRTHEPVEAKRRQFTYSEVLKITNNFGRAIGKGGFGTVYHGNLDGAQVAVKMLSPSSVQGYKEFAAEVKVLLRVHHRNLTSLVGYCDEGANLGLIYEYMANGTLKDYLSIGWGDYELQQRQLKGDIMSIVDPRLRGDFNINSAWKIVEIAVACVSSTSARRPTMNQVVIELNECLALEMARTREGSDIDTSLSQDSPEFMCLNVHTGMSPLGSLECFVYKLKSNKNTAGTKLIGSAMEVVVQFFLFAVLSGAFSLSVLVQAQNQSGFISIDCGIEEGSSYRDESAGIHYISDANYKNVGVRKYISSEINTTNIYKQYLNLRSFPDGTKTCYTLKPAEGRNNKYLIRAGFGTPFISVLELRLLDYNTYDNATELMTDRLDCGLNNSNMIRFSDDVYDRFWSPYLPNECEVKNTSYTVESPDRDEYRIPSRIMQTAAVLANNSNTIQFFLTRDDPTSQFFLYLHFAEIEELQANQTREFSIFIDGKLWHGPTVPTYLQTATISSTSVLNGSAQFHVEINKTQNSTLPPLLNAIELYLVQELLQSETYQEDAHGSVHIFPFISGPSLKNLIVFSSMLADAIMNIKSYYKVKRYWQGDPCAPKVAIWQGTLSSSGLSGEISPDIFNLKIIQYLDLSNNSLRGSVPNFLSHLPYLRVLNLSENELSGSVPSELIERSKNGTLTLKGESKERHFAYSDVLTITTNFERTLGKGQFATACYIEDIQVAVKIFSSSLAQAYKKFAADAKLLTKVHHRNLIAYLGYCDEEGNNALIYECMTNGNLEDILSGSTKEYYLDPDYYVTNKLKERSDVYSFGIVLLAIITSRPVTVSNQESAHIIEWASSLLGRGDIKGIVDSRLQGDYLIDSVWKAAELAMACESRTSVKRPVVTQIVMELNQCLAMEISRISRSEGTIEMVSVNLGTGVIPEAR
ncbi:unnamed protein product [Dovyalis caffra]|uniref:non-specific serine/threonine protein kinase n=1 Tax=Dovyalis caffra TaxID=77055 RepID=A0AAV1SST9_9ROSI|nr:unnamed protein product [Dovyalis caffra]